MIEEIHGALRVDGGGDGGVALHEGGDLVDGLGDRVEHRGWGGGEETTGRGGVHGVVVGAAE